MTIIHVSAISNKNEESYDPISNEILVIGAWICQDITFTTCTDTPHSAKPEIHNLMNL